MFEDTRNVETQSQRRDVGMWNPYLQALSMGSDLEIPRIKMNHIFESNSLKSKCLLRELTKLRIRKHGE